MHTFDQESEATRLPVFDTSPMVRQARLEQSPDVNPILNLQRTIGNRGVQRLVEANTTAVKQDADLSRVRPQLSIGALDDPLEREADRMADAVMADGAAHQPGPSRSPSPLEAVRSMAPAPIAAEHAKRAFPDGGRPLSENERTYFEPRFFSDLSEVRLHTGPAANAAARGLGARAFTVGADIGFATPVIPPRTLAHELAHVVQPHGTEPVLRRDPDDDADETQTAAKDVGDWRCGGNKCITDEEIYADVNRSHAEDVAAEEKATAERKRRLEIKRHGSKQQKWEIEFLEDPRLRKDIGAVAGTRDDGTMTASGVRVPTYLGDYLSPRPFYERRDAAMLAYQGFIHYAEIVEAGQGQAALDLALATNGGYPIPDDKLNLRGYAGWSERAHDARDKAMILAMVAEAGAAGEAAAADLAIQRAETTIAQQLKDLIGKPAALRGAEMTVQGVGISGIRVNVIDGELVASYDTIVNLSRISNQGKRIQSAFEAATVKAARDAGLNSARVAVQNIINQEWKAYLLSLGYTSDMMELQPGVFSWVLTKVF